MKGIVISAITSVTLLPALIIICGVLQTGNSYLFTDTKSGNKAISEVFGSNNSVVLVYKNSDDNFENEKTLADKLYAYRTKDGKAVLTSYTAYTNTVRELYDIQKAVQKLDISEHDAELLFTMYNLYRSPASVKMTFAEFVDFANGLLETDEDAKDFTEGDTAKTLETLKVIAEITENDLAAQELYEKLTTGVMEGTDVDLFSIKQLYGLYFYDDVAEKSVDFKTMLDFMIAASENENISSAFDAATVVRFGVLSAGITEFETQMEMLMDKATLKGWIYKNCGVALSDITSAEIEKDKISGVYIKYATNGGKALSDPMMACDLLDFVSDNMDTNSLLKKKMSDDNRKKGR